jgi:hypothetical protein
MKAAESPNEELHRIASINNALEDLYPDDNVPIIASRSISNPTLPTHSPHHNKTLFKGRENDLIVEDLEGSPRGKGVNIFRKEANDDESSGPPSSIHYKNNKAPDFYPISAGNSESKMDEQKDDNAAETGRRPSILMGSNPLKRQPPTQPPSQFNQTQSNEPKIATITLQNVTRNLTYSRAPANKKYEKK